MKNCLEGKFYQLCIINNFDSEFVNGGEKIETTGTDDFFIKITPAASKEAKYSKKSSD
jgi:hypothetical protein